MVGDLIEKYKQYFHSLRFRDGNVIMLDMKIPNKWVIENLPEGVEHTIATDNYDISNSLKTISFIVYGEESINSKGDRLINTVDNVIKFNVENEIKEKLLEKNINDLRNFIINNDIETIKNLNFNNNENKGD